MNCTGVAAIANALAGDEAATDELLARLDDLVSILETPSTTISAGLFGAMASVARGDAAGARRWAPARHVGVGPGPPRPPLAGRHGDRGVGPLDHRRGRRRRRRRRRHGRDRRQPDAHRHHAHARRAGRDPLARRRPRGGHARRRTGPADAAERGERFWLPELLRLQAELAIAAGAPAGAVLALLDDAVAVAEAQGEPPLAARAPGDARSDLGLVAGATWHALAMRVTRLWRYPVKSMQGEALPDAVDRRAGHRGRPAVGAGGARPPARPSPPGASRGCSTPAPASSAADGVEVVLPDGAVASGDEQLSRWLGYDVELRRATDQDQGMFEIAADFEHEDTSEWISWEGPKGSFHDSGRTQVSIASDGSFQDWDERRFRINVIVDGDGEAEFVGQHVRLGEVTLDVVKPIGPLRHHDPAAAGRHRARPRRPAHDQRQARRRSSASARSC